MMKKKLLHKLIRSGKGKGTLFAAAFGMLVGYFILFIAIQMYFDINNLFNNDKDLIQKDFIIINKKVSLLNTLKVLDTGFSEKEIAQLKKQNFVEKVEPVTPNRFKVGAYTDGKDDIPPFYAEMFFESVPDQFLDIESEKWQWAPGSPYIPVVIPRDYLKLYNFGFAQSQNLPQISEELASKATVDFIIEGSGKRKTIKGRIVGFSDRINSFLVPESFMQWANKEYGRPDKNRGPSRLILVSNRPDSPELYRYLQDNNYEANTRQTKASRLNILLQILLGIVSFIGLIIIVLAVLVFSVSYKLMIARAGETIDKLFILGYDYRHIARIYILNYGSLLFAVLLLSFAFLWLAKHFIAGLFDKMGYVVTPEIDMRVIGLGLTISFLLLVFNARNLISQFKRRAS
jgi:hypothetical protein